MGTHLWLTEDLRNILVSARVTSELTAQCAPVPSMVMYLHGYRSALAAVALACGIPPEQLGFGPEADVSIRSTISGVESSVLASSQPAAVTLEASMSRDHHGRP
jgi:hypothetical protein